MAGVLRTCYRYLPVVYWEPKQQWLSFLVEFWFLQTLLPVVLVAIGDHLSRNMCFSDLLLPRNRGLQFKLVETTCDDSDSDFVVHNIHSEANNKPIHSGMHCWYGLIPCNTNTMIFSNNRNWNYANCTSEQSDCATSTQEETLLPDN